VVGEGAQVAVVAAIDTVRVGLAEFALVLFRVVKVFHPVVRPLAGILVRTVARHLTQLRGVKGRRPPPVFFVGLVVEEAFLGVVSHLVFAWLSLEPHQIKQQDAAVVLLADATRVRAVKVRQANSIRGD
jgi:hypothetical protein